MNTDSDHFWLSQYFYADDISVYHCVQTSFKKKYALTQIHPLQLQRTSAVLNQGFPTGAHEIQKHILYPHTLEHVTINMKNKSYNGSLLFAYNLKGRAQKMQNLCGHPCAIVHSQVKGCSCETQTHRRLLY